MKRTESNYKSYASLDDLDLRRPNDAFLVFQIVLEILCSIKLEIISQEPNLFKEISCQNGDDYELYPSDKVACNSAKMVVQKYFHVYVNEHHA